MSLTRRLQILIDDDRYAALEREAARTERSVAAVVREALDARLGRGGPAPDGPGRRLLAAPAIEVGEPEELAAELAELGERLPPS